MDDKQRTADLLTFARELKAELAQSKLDTARASLSTKQAELKIVNRKLYLAREDELRAVVKQGHPGWTQGQVDAYVKGHD